MSWTLLGLRDLSTAIRRQAQSCDPRISLGWKDSDTSDSTARHLEGFQQLSRYLWGTGGWWQWDWWTTPAPLPLCRHRAQHPDRPTLQPTLRGSTEPWGPVCNRKRLFRHGWYHLAFSMPHDQACLFAEVSDEPPQMLFLEARTVIKGAGTQPRRLPAFSITPQDFRSDPIKRCRSQESWLGLTLRKRQKFPVLPLLFCSCVSSFSLSSCFY